MRNSFDFDREFTRTRNRVNWIFRLAVVGIILSAIVAVAQYAALGYAAIKYGPRYLEAGVKVLEGK